MASGPHPVAPASGRPKPDLRTRPPFIAWALLVAAAAWPARAQVSPPSPLTESRAVEAALARDDLRDALAGIEAAAEAEAVEAGLAPNPVLDYDEERIDGTGGRTTERFLRLSQAFDLSGRRGLRRAAAESRLDATRAEAAVRRAEVAAETRRAFAEALFRSRQVDLLADWARRIGAAEDMVASLARAGDAAGYDRRRLTRERVAAQARLAAARAESGRGQVRLAALTGQAHAGMQAPAGDLLPDPPGPVEPWLAKLAARPEFRALAARAQSFERDRQAADRGWIPDVTLGAGVKRVDDPLRTDNGLLLTVSVPLPLFDRGQAGVQRAAAQALAARGELSLARSRAEGELRGRWRMAGDLQEAAQALRAGTASESATLTRIAEAAYAAGETALLELLDAYRTSLEAETQALDLELSARLARIELDLTVGEIQP